MFDPFRPAPRRSALEEDLLALCNARQIEVLSIPQTLRRDVGLDCGCDPLPRRSSRFFWTGSTA